MLKDRVVLDGLSADMWLAEHIEHVKNFFTNPDDKILVLRVTNESLVSVISTAIG